MNAVDAFNQGLVKELRLYAEVRRACVCGEPATGWTECPKCTRAAVVEKKGLVAYRHKKWYMNLAYKLGFIK